MKVPTGVWKNIATNLLVGEGAGIRTLRLYRMPFAKHLRCRPKEKQSFVESAQSHHQLWRMQKYSLSKCCRSSISPQRAGLHDHDQSTRFATPSSHDLGFGAFPVIGDTNTARNKGVAEKCDDGCAHY